MKLKKIQGPIGSNSTRANSAIGMENVNHIREKAYITSNALNEILRTIGTKEAETGGMLIGPANRDGITDIIFDEEGSCSRVTYSPSHENLTNICKAAAEKGYELKGICHSHPGLRTPSGGDMQYIKKFFYVNPSLKKFYLPILPGVPIRGVSDDNHDLSSLSNYIKFYVIYRYNPTDYEKAEIVISNKKEMPEVKQDKAIIINYGNSKIDIEWLESLLQDTILSKSSVDVNNKSISCLIANTDETEVILLMPTEFPILSPTVIITREGEESVQYPFKWAFQSSKNIEERVACLINAALKDNLGTF